MAFNPKKSYSGKCEYRQINGTLLSAITNCNKMFGQYNNSVKKFYVANNYTALNTAYVATTSGDYASGLYTYGANNTDYNIDNDIIKYTGGYTGLTLQSYPVIVYIQLDQLKNRYISSSFSAHYFYKLYCRVQESLTDSHKYAYTKNDVWNYADFIATFGNDYYIKDVKFYVNSNDGSYSTSNPRTLAFLKSGGDVFARYSFPNIYSNNLAETWTGDGDALIPIYGSFFTAYDDTTVKGVYLHNTLQYAYTFGADTVNTKTNSILTSNSTKAFHSLTTLYKQLSAIGIPFTTDMNVALYGNSANFPEYIAPNQPTNTTGGGTGNGDNISDDVETETIYVSPLSSFNAQYAVSQSQLNVLSEYMWTATFLTDIKLLFNDPAESVISCRLYPFSLDTHDTGHLGTVENIKIGNVTTSATAFPIINGYDCIFDAGTISINEYFGSALDYDPYTTVQIYLPYIGIKDLSTAEVMGKTLSIKYIIDITTGTCVAQIWVASILLYTYEGKIGVDIPLSSSNASQFATNLALNSLSSIGGIATGIATGNPLVVAGSVISTAKSVASNQIHVNRGGINSPTSGLYMPQTAYAIIERPIQSLASTFGSVHGFPCNVSKLLETVTGYTEVENLTLLNIPATEEEKTQIKNLLETGVIFA